MQKMLEWALSLLKREMDNGIYGSVTFHFQNGKIHTCKVEQSEKPPALDGDK